MRLLSFASVRILLLLTILTVVGLTTLHQRVYTRNWNQSLQVTIFPLNGDGYTSTANYIDSLLETDFTIIERWGVREAKRYDLALPQPFQVSLGPTINKLPPKFPMDGSSLDNLVWGLQFRWWAWRHTPDDDASLTRVRMFVIYQEGDDTPLAHSLGMQKGLMGLVHAFADRQQNSQNNVVIAHELLHTVGAIDKYSDSGHPFYPAGYADSARKPLYPQRYAEIMAGRIPTSANSAYMAESLRSVIINPHTATEINWLD